MKVHYIAHDTMPDLPPDEMIGVLQIRDQLWEILAKALGEDPAHWDGAHKTMCIVETLYWMAVETAHELPGDGAFNANLEFSHHIAMLMDAWRSHPMNDHRRYSEDQGMPVEVYHMVTEDE